MNVFATPFLMRLNATVDAAFPRTLLRAAFCLHGARGSLLAHRPRRPRYADRLMMRLEPLRNDVELREYLAWRARISEIVFFYLAALRTLNRMHEEPPDSEFYQQMRKLLGSDPQALQMIRVGLPMTS